MKQLKLKKIHSYLWIVLMAICLAACSDDDELKQQETNFLSYQIKGYENAKTTIDQDTHTITIQLPEEVTSGKNLVPEFTVSDGAQASINRVVQKSGENALDFDNVVLYTVSNADYTVKTRWHIIVTNNDYTARYGMGNFLTDWWSNNGTDPKGYYLEQQHTGPYSDVNCGPACATMAMKWRNPAYAGSVEDTRNSAVHSEIDNGTWWYPRDIYNFLYRNNVDAYYWDFTGATYDGFIREICSLLENNNLCIVCLNNGNISEQTATNKEYHTGRYYTGGSGHFILIKGYRVVNGVTWFEVHDPWGLDLKYSDGTYYGANRYYLGSEVATSIDWNVWTVVVPYQNSESSAKAGSVFSFQ